MKKILETAGEEEIQDKLLNDGYAYLFLERILQSSPRDFFVFLCLTVAFLHILTSTIDSDTDREVCGEGKESSGFLPTLPTVLYTFSIFAQYNFTTGCRNRGDDREGSGKDAMNIEDNVCFLM